MNVQLLSEGESLSQTGRAALAFGKSATCYLRLRRGHRHLTSMHPYDTCPWGFLGMGCHCRTSTPSEPVNHVIRACISNAINLSFNREIGIFHADLIVHAFLDFLISYTTTTLVFKVRYDAYYKRYC